MAQKKVRLVSNPGSKANPGRRRRHRSNPTSRRAPVVGRLSVPTSNEVIGVLAGATGGTMVTGFSRQLVSNVMSTGGRPQEALVIGLAAAVNFAIGAFSGKAIGSQKGVSGKELGTGYVMGATAVHSLQFVRDVLGLTEILGIQLPSVSDGATAPAPATSGFNRRALPAGRQAMAVRPQARAIPSMAGAAGRSRQTGVGNIATEEDGMFTQVV